MEKKKISERKVIEFTAGLVVLTGLVRLVAYVAGTVLFYLAFAPFLVFRLVSTFQQRKNKRSSVYFYRVIVMVVMIITIVLNAVGWQDADFFLMFLLMVDYLLVINRRF